MSAVVVRENRSAGMFGIAHRVLTEAINNADHKSPDESGGYYWGSNRRWTFADGSILAWETWDRLVRRTP